MGKEKYIKEIENLFEKSPIVNFSSIERIIKKKKAIKHYPKQLIRNLYLRGKIKRLTKGCYTVKNNVLLSVFCFKPAYFGLQDALSFHDLWEQETIPVIITTKKVRQGIRAILDTNVLIRRIDKKYFFGFDYRKQGNVYLPVSNIEKTIIDMIYFKENLNNEVLENAKEKINLKKLEKYLRKYPKKFRETVKNKLFI